VHASIPPPDEEPEDDDAVPEDEPEELPDDEPEDEEPVSDGESSTDPEEEPEDPDEELDAISDVASSTDPEEEPELPPPPPLELLEHARGIAVADAPIPTTTITWKSFFVVFKASPVGKRLPPSPAWAKVPSGNVLVPNATAARGTKKHKRVAYTARVQSRAWVGLGVSVVASLVWWSCSNSSAGGGGAADAGEAGDDASDAAVIEESDCNPCFQFCACTPGQTLYSPTLCMTYTCPPNGVWGVMGCTGPSMCADASDEGAAATDAATDASGDVANDGLGDARIDASGDGPSDAISETAEASSD
jgi:hypothetical protein